MPVDAQVQAVLDLIKQANSVPYTQLDAGAARLEHERTAAALDAPPERIHALADIAARTLMAPLRCASIHRPSARRHTLESFGYTAAVTSSAASPATIQSVAVSPWQATQW